MGKNKTFGILFIVTIVFLSFALRGKLSGEKFDRKKWKNWTESEMELSTRWDMMNSLRNNHDLKGKTKNEIINLLGKPEFEETNSEFSYYLGYSRRGINTGRLIFYIGLDGKICDFKVYQG